MSMASLDAFLGSHSVPSPVLDGREKALDTCRGVPYFIAAQQTGAALAQTPIKSNTTISKDYFRAALLQLRRAKCRLPVRISKVDPRHSDWIENRGASLHYASPLHCEVQTNSSACFAGLRLRTTVERLEYQIELLQAKREGREEEFLEEYLSRMEKEPDYVQDMGEFFKNRATKKVDATSGAASSSVAMEMEESVAEAAVLIGGEGTEG